MQTQVQCPQCRGPVTADLYQVIDVGRVPQMKQALMSGMINVAQCPSCGATFQVKTPLLYHDPAHELFMVHIPTEMNLPMHEQEKLVGNLTRAVVDATPQEEFRSYMLQPETIITMKTFMEKVMATEGITPEMIARQNEQVQLIQKLGTVTDKEVRDILLTDNSALIDDQFFSIMAQVLQSAEQAQQEDVYINLINLQAKLMRETDVGKARMATQVALHHFQQDAKEAGGLSPQLLFKHIIANEENEQIWQSIVGAGTQALQYEFFALVTAEIEARESAKNAEGAERLTAIRSTLLEVYDGMQEASKEIMAAYDGLIGELKSADNLEEKLAENGQLLDEGFMQYLALKQAEAEQTGNTTEFEAIERIQAGIMGLMTQGMPPEILLMNTLVSAETPEKAQAILDESADLITPEFKEMLSAVADQAKERGEEGLVGRISKIQQMILAKT